VSGPDIAGLVGVLLILLAYAGGVSNQLDAKRAPALLMNLTGALLILFSLYFERNLSAIVMEAAWALIALIGLLRLAVNRPRRRRSGFRRS
jgi:hypothetical protein